MKDPFSGLVQVKIYDRDFAVRTTGDPDELRALCAWLDERMRQISKSSGAVDTLKVSVLTSLTLAAEVQRLEELLKKMDESLSKRSLECVSMLDRFLA
jgi:cell division protein ZapA (FtsZ GTPase activity inhibitor)